MYTDPAQHLTTADTGSTIDYIDDLDRDLSDVDYLDDLDRDILSMVCNIIGSEIRSHL